MIPQKVEGLLVAGVGTVAAVALQENVSPAEVDIKKVQQILFG